MSEGPLGATTRVDDTVAATAEERAGVAGAALDSIERALGRVADGTYGRCEECGEEIDDALLEAAPAATRCARHGAPAPG
ncbi:MAG TPA: TraR/DksA C4-type zinc finger protein [Acidimicrobiales bacterium]|nr:TraR/DksA C4-type zinc finger protein [Acidimicrobiales bacterium]